MANIKSQKKRIITNEKSRMRNRAVKSELKTATRRVKDAVAAGNGAEAYAAACAACRLMDKAASKGVIHKNQAANRKSGIMALANTVATDADRAAYVKPAKKEQKTGSKKAERKAARLAEMNAASEEKAKRREKQLKHHEHELAEKKRLEATARSMHEHGTEHLAKRAASIEKRIARMKVTDRPKTDKKMSVTFGDPNYETEEVLKVRDITKSYDGREILHDVSFNIRNRERVALLGANGAGKTTMLKILLGEEAPDSGTIRKGVGLKPAYLPQQVHFVNPHRNLIDTLIYDKNVSMQVARNRLGAFQFTGETQMKTVDMLSGGEKSRLRLCELMYDPLNLLILDEPTNHLDLASREWIEEAVEAFDGTLLFVSHDRYFVERFATRVLYLENGHLIDFIGSYSAFLDWRAKGGGALPEAEAAPVPKKKKAAVPTLDDVPKPPEKPKRTGGTKNLQKQLSTLEREISQLETQSGDLEQQMVDAASDSSRLLELMTEKEQCDEKLAAKMDEWEAVAAELEAMQ